MIAMYISRDMALVQLYKDFNLDCSAFIRFTTTGSNFIIIFPNSWLKLLLLYFVMSQLDNLTQFCVLSKKSHQIYRKFILYFRSSKNPCLEMTFL